MSATAEMETIEGTKHAEPKVNLPHPWAGRICFYWREVNQTTHEISPLPAMLIAPTRASDGWDLNFWRLSQMQGRANVKFSATPKAGCFTWAVENPTGNVPSSNEDAAVSDEPLRRGPGRPRKIHEEE
jgi:hypothetical protein